MQNVHKIQNLAKEATFDTKIKNYIVSKVQSIVF